MANKFRWAVTRSPASDPQQYRVYRMESEAIGARGTFSMSRPAIRKLIRSLCRNYGTKPIKVVFTDLGKFAAQWVPPNVIELNTEKSTSHHLLTITHEFSHHLHEHLAPGALHQSHGPEFMACHMSVLDTCRYIPVDAMKVVCDRYRVKYLDPGMRQSLSALRRLLKV